MTQQYHGFNNTQPLQLSNLDSDGPPQGSRQKPTLSSATPKQFPYQEARLLETSSLALTKTHRGVVFNNFFTTDQQQPDPRGYSSKLAKSGTNLNCSHGEDSESEEHGQQHSPDFKSNIIKERRSKQQINGMSIQNRMHRI